MRKFYIILISLIVLLLCYAIYTLNSTGTFRSIKPIGEDKVVQTIMLKGAEDITASSTDSFALISATNRIVYPPGEEESGDLYYLDHRLGAYTLTNLTNSLPDSFAPHGISMLPMASGYRVLAISHTLNHHTIYEFKLEGMQLSFVRTYSNPSMVSPNDIVIVDENRFYFTNDHGYTKGIGKFLEEYLGLAVSNVIYFDGSSYREVAKEIAYANGINLDRERNLLYVASARGFHIKVYEVKDNGSLEYINDIDCHTGVDNIELDDNGKIYTAGHPNLLRWQAFAKGKKPIAPSEVIEITYKSNGDYTYTTPYLEDGSLISGSSVACPFGDLILVGTVMDDEILVLER